MKIILTLVVIAVVAIGVFLIMNSGGINKPQLTPSPSPTLTTSPVQSPVQQSPVKQVLPGKKIWENSKYGFELQYPTSLVKRNREIAIHYPYTWAPLLNETTNLERTELVELIPTQTQSEISITFSVFIAKYDEVYKMIRDIFLKLDVNPELEDKIIAGKQGFMVNVGAEGEGNYTYFVPLASNRVLMILDAYHHGNLRSFSYPPGGHKSFEEQRKIFNEVISTLKIQ